jgi:hypothetical protein
LKPYPVSQSLLEIYWKIWRVAVFLIGIQKIKEMIYYFKVKKGFNQSYTMVKFKTTFQNKILMINMRLAAAASRPRYTDCNVISQLLSLSNELVGQIKSPLYFRSDDLTVKILFQIGEKAEWADKSAHNRSIIDRMYQLSSRVTTPSKICPCAILQSDPLNFG